MDKQIICFLMNLYFAGLSLFRAFWDICENCPMSSSHWACSWTSMMNLCWSLKFYFCSANICFTILWLFPSIVLDILCQDYVSVPGGRSQQSHTKAAHTVSSMKDTRTRYQRGRQDYFSHCLSFIGQGIYGGEIYVCDSQFQS